MSARMPRSPDRDRWDRRHFDRPPFQHRDVDGRARERRAAEAGKYRKTLERVPSTEYIDRNRENERPPSRDSSIHESRRTSPKQPSSTALDPKLGEIFASSIQSLNKLLTTKEILRLRRDKAKQDYDEAKMFYDRGKVNATQFPSEAERAKTKYMKESATLEDFDKKLKEIDTNIASAEAAVATHFQTLASSKVEERVSKPDFDIDERFSRLEKQYQNLSHENRKLKEDYAWLEEDMKDQMQKANSKTAKDLASISASLASRTENDVSLSKSIIELKTDSSKYNDQISQVQAQLIQFQALIDSLPDAATTSSNDEVFRQRMQSLEAGLATATTLNSQLAPRIEALESSQMHLTAIQNNFTELQNNIKSFDEDLLAHNDRISSLENSSGDANLSEKPRLANTSTENITGQMQQINALEVATKGLKVEVFALKESHNVGDKLYGELMDGFQTALEKLKTTVSDIEANRKAHQTSIANLEVQQNKITNEQQQLSSSLEMLKSKLSHSTSTSSPELDGGRQVTKSGFPPDSLENGVSKPVFDNSSLQSQLKEVKDQQVSFQHQLFELKNRQLGTDLGISSLDARMNNVNTEHLSRQIISQLQTVYLPQSIKKCNDSLELLEKVVRDHTESLRYLGETGMEQKNQLQADKADLNKAIDEVRDTLTSKFQTWEVMAKKEFAECHNQVTSFKSNFTENISLITNGLQKQIANIEGIIEFDDDDGKTETVKEKVKVLTEHYGTLSGHVDVLSDQISLLKKGASSRHTTSTSRAGSVGPGSGSPSGTDRLTRKRNAPTSPLSTHMNATSGPSKNKRRRNDFGPFLDDEEGSSDK